MSFLAGKAGRVLRGERGVKGKEGILNSRGWRRNVLIPRHGKRNRPLKVHTMKGGGGVFVLLYSSGILKGIKQER